MNNRDRFIMYITALTQFMYREGHPDVPAIHVEILDGQEVKLGSWVGYVRQRYRQGLLPEERFEALSLIPGWQWGPLKPGPKSQHERNKRILEERRAGRSLQQIADVHGLTRQRIHQIITTEAVPVD